MANNTALPGAAPARRNRAASSLSSSSLEDIMKILDGACSRTVHTKVVWVGSDSEVKRGVANPSTR